MRSKFNYIQEKRTKDGVAFLLRPAETADTKAIEDNILAVCAEKIYLHSDNFVLTSEWRQALAHSVDENNGQLLIVAQVENNVVGHLRLFAEWYGAKGRHVGEIGLSIIQPWRARGIGTAMLTYIFNWARYVHFQKLAVSVIAANRQALNLFSKFGFVQEGRRVRQFCIKKNYVDEILLAKFIK